MAHEELQRVPPREHSLTIGGRERMSLSGVEDVTGFDESMVVLLTSLGELTVRGEELHVEKIDLDAGRLELRGKIRELSYDEPARGGSLLSRLFG